ncbi:YdcF family protein [Pseudoalteromonas umbrosa]|uniref:YdcF family protein n=1 Tax=Pseudoalteromonas umbrosa TaxID=3048489 RepID=UPI0024C28618|nr:ElyC/SanA/YdcF family protein [Pseudoalteromonas sp. B95]MDK1287544.1 ElyC/SanA/YdcF family protein [Pseudoalteromonas sp. B95]
MFELKKIIGSLLMPLPASLIFIFLLLLIISKTNKKSFVLCLSSVVALWLISTPYVADLIITPKEQSISLFSEQQHNKVDAIVVLGSGLHPNTKLAANQQLSSTALARLVEGVRLAHQYPQAKLVVSGAGFNNTTSSELMAKTAQALGISLHRIRQNPNAYDTADEAKLLAPMLVDSNVVLVTSASHMSRAQDLFSAQGIDTHSSPVEIYGFSTVPFYRQFIASSYVLQAITTYTHEWIGQQWITLRRMLDSESL